MPFHLPEFQAFRCTGCGRCCRPWAVAIEEPQRQAIEDSEAFRQRRHCGLTPLQVVQPGRAELGDRGDGRCTFLDQDNGCELHRELGGRQKPLGCQLFPYQVVRTPLGLFASLSFACPPVVEGHDRGVELNRQELEEALRPYLDPLETSPDQPFLVGLSAQRSLPWQEYLELEDRLLTQFCPQRPVRSLLGLLLELLWRGALPPTEEDLDFALEMSLKYLSSLVLYLEESCAPPASEAWEPGQRQALLNALQSGQSSSSPGRPQPLPPLECDPRPPAWMGETFHRYWKNQVQGKTALRSHLADRLLRTAAAIALTAFYTEVFRVSRAGHQATLEDLVEAFALVENEAVSHSSATAPFFAEWEALLNRIAQG